MVLCPPRPRDLLPVGSGTQAPQEALYNAGPAPGCA